MKHPDTAQLAREARARTGLSREAFAKLIASGTRSVANWEDGDKPPLPPARLILAGLVKGLITADMLREMAA